MGSYVCSYVTVEDHGMDITSIVMLCVASEILLY